MTGFIEGVNRDQTTLFPVRLEDWIGEDNLVRVVDLFGDELDLAALDFHRHAAVRTGRRGCHPAVLLKLFIYGHPFRQPLRDHVSTTWPLGPGDELRGEPVFERRHYSVGAMARLLRVEATALRDKLGPDLSEFSRRKPDDWALFDTGKAKSALSDLTTRLTNGQFCKCLSLSPDLFQDLAGCGILDEAWSENGGGWDLIAGQGIVERLLLGAQQVGRLAPEWMPIDQAAVHVGCSPAQIVERIRDGRLPWVGRHLKRSGFASILVNLSGHDGGEISAEMFAQSQGLTFSEMLSFFRKDHSPAEIAKRETGRKDRVMLTPEQVAAFHENFVSFRRLALAHRLSWDALDQHLEGFGIAPVDGCAWH